MNPPGDEGFLARWSRRKVQVREGTAPQAPVPAAAAVSPVAAVAVPAPAVDAPLPVAGSVPDAAAPSPPAEPAPTLADVATLTPASDFRRFVASGVEPEVKHAALKKLFTDPHFNTMDGLDTYIDDYGRPDPLPQALLRQMVQSQFLGLWAEAPPNPAPEAPAAAPDEDADLRLQPHDAAGPAGLAPGADPEPRQQ
ncbi:MAG: DUF3306 domain-containing protein [Burkholderiales bacterium]|nr:DUF3306 domain-containing protein [Burkholderiales bacterium]